jgi:hypothetical protein
MSWQVGEPVVVEATLTDPVTGKPIAKAGTDVVVRLKPPKGSVFEAPVTNDTEGEYVAEAELTEKGKWKGWLIVSGGTYRAKRPFHFEVFDE